MAEAADAGNSQPAELSKVAEQGEEWAIRRHVRVGRPREKDKNQTQKRVYESNEESGLITLNIFSTGHFFISQGRILLVGFSLISAKSWLKIGKNLDWLLFSSKIKGEFRVFKVQFDGDTKDKAQKNCDCCFQRLQHFFYSQGIVVGTQGSDVDMICPCPPSNVELCTFLKFCLLDQHFPGFVEAVEKELYKFINN
ncbi:meiotic recombination protein REC114 isoform X2 [Dendropsophus ebraccatus]|uniref:meiotic recombination protein REC114 isoform X2 n=1 Tax=Dendropsophus ebraccatus TaxID=150705 RepID=UPI003831A1FE